MTTQELIQFCHYYKGEKECPSTDKIFAQLWTAEMMACTDLINMVSDNNPKHDLHNVVFAYVSKWNPYSYWETLDEYIKKAHPDQSIVNTYYN